MPTGRPTSRLSAKALLLVGLALGCTNQVASAPQHKTRRSPPAPSSRDVEQETTATIPAKPVSAKPVLAKPTRAPAAITTPAKPDDETLPPPFHLPAASRARMRECGIKWQAMKESGEAGDEIWRDFATHCLAAASGPLERR